MRIFFAAASYLLLTSVSIAPLMHVHNHEQILLTLLAVICCWFALWSVFRHPRNFHFLLLPAFLLTPVELFLQTHFRQGLTAHHIGIATESTMREAFEFSGGMFWYFCAAQIIMLCWWAAVFAALRNTPALTWHGPTRLVMLAIVTCCTGLALYDWGASIAKAESIYLNQNTSQPVQKRKVVSTSMFSSVSPFTKGDLEKAWPFSLALVATDYLAERQNLNELMAKNKDFRFHANATKLSGKNKVIVMVIGESSRYDRWEINGYTRSTTSRLKAEKNLVSFSDIITPVSATRLSVPIMLTRKPAQLGLQKGFNEKSFLTAFSEAGYKTYWLSNQLTLGNFDTPVSVYAKEADIIQYVNIGGADHRSSFDEALLPPLRTALADKHPLKLIVLHTMGSHWNYGERYPRLFDHWKPSILSGSNATFTDRRYKELVNNSYDSSIRYTDWFLGQVIDVLNKTEQPTALLYSADHGQVLYDGMCEYAFHGRSTAFEFHIPAFVWYSQQLASEAESKDKLNNLQLNKDKKLTTENLFHSLVDLGGIEYPTQDLHRSVFSNKFLSQQRLVDAGVWTDYDAAELRGDCREVVPGNNLGSSPR